METAIQSKRYRKQYCLGEPRKAGMLCCLYVAAMMIFLHVHATLPGSFSLKSWVKDRILFTSETLRTPEKISELLVITPFIPFPAKADVTKAKKVSPKLLAHDFPPFRGKKGEKKFHPIISKVSREQEVESALIKAVIMAESSYNPRAVSEKGAQGLMQLMPETAQSLGVDNSFDPEQNIRGGVSYLRQLIERFDGDIPLAVAAYNAGYGHVLKYNGIPPFEATQYYVRKVFHYYHYYKGQENKTEQADGSEQHESREKAEA